MSVDLKRICEAVAPVKQLTPIQLHELPTFTLLSLLNDFICHIDPSHPAVDVRSEDPALTQARILDFAANLKFPADSEVNITDKDSLLAVLDHLSRDVDSHRKRAYLALYLTPVFVPDELGDEEIRRMQAALADLQSQFKDVHKYAESIRKTGSATADIKKDCMVMEDEKRMVLAKIARVRQQVNTIPNNEMWLEAAKSLRIEQNNEIDIAEKIKDQKVSIQQAEDRYVQIQQQLKEVRTAFSGNGPESLYNKLKEEEKMNKFMSTERLPQEIDDKRRTIRDLSRIIHEPAISESDISQLEARSKDLNEAVAKLAEKKLIKNSSGEDKLALFRQQATIIARKKEGAVEKMTSLQKDFEKLTKELAEKQDGLTKAQGSKMLKGEDFKKYVAELREKSQVYKAKKAELAEIVAEMGILQRTEEILQTKEKALKSTIVEIEKKSGVEGYQETQETLEKISERKGTVDEHKGKTLEEISRIVEQLMQSIMEKKTQLAPVIQQLRTMRQQLADLEAEYADKKRVFDATMIGLDSETTALETELAGYRSDIVSDQSKQHHLKILLQNIEIAQDRISQEMKTYIGGDEITELQQKARGFKSYRDLYNKKITEQENVSKALREKQKNAKNNHEPNMHQKAIFDEIRTLLNIKLQVVGKSAEQREAGNRAGTENRLVL